MTAFDDLNDAIFADENMTQPASYIPSGGMLFPIVVILDREYSDPQGVGIAGVSTSAPVAFAKTVDVPDAKRGDTLITDVDGVSTTFNITEVMPDGTGVTLLRLSED